jgi:hypothetical protein
MRHTSDRKIKVNKWQLVTKIKENKANHIKEYEQALKDYKEEAQKQLDEQAKRLAEGKTDLKLQLVSPLNKTEDYDKLIAMFEVWEVEEFVELSQGEFNEYIMDETDFAIQAKGMNTFYSSRRG